MSKTELGELAMTIGLAVLLVLGKLKLLFYILDRWVN